MDSDKKSVDIQVGKRLREARNNINVDKAELAEMLNVTLEHYRKLEAGSTGLSAHKMLILYENYGIDPTYLITGKCNKSMDFDLDYYVANSSKEQRNEFFERVFAYMSKLLK